MIAFLFGFAYELVFLFWLYCAEKGQPALCALASMVVGVVSLKGLAEALKGKRKTIFLVLGYGAGSYAVALWRAHAL